jgi:hypothetical protein
MDVVLVALLVLAQQAVPLALAIAPPVTMLARRRATWPALALYLAGLAFLVAWVLAMNHDMDRADETGGAGSILAGGQWLLAAVLAGAASVWWTIRASRARAVGPVS